MISTPIIWKGLCTGIGCKYSLCWCCPPVTITHSGHFLHKAMVLAHIPSQYRCLTSALYSLLWCESHFVQYHMGAGSLGLQESTSAAIRTLGSTNGCACPWGCCTRTCMLRGSFPKPTNFPSMSCRVYSFEPPMGSFKVQAMRCRWAPVSHLEFMVQSRFT